MRPVDPNELAALLQHGGRLVDIRPWELVLKRPLDAALHLPLERIQRGESPNIAKDATVIVVCEWGRKSALAGLYLEARGFSDVRHLRGGVAALPPNAPEPEQTTEREDPATDATPGTEPR